MDKCSIIRSVHHSHQGHNSAMYWSIVGRPYPIDSTLINPSRTDLPSLGTLVGWLAQRDHYSGSLPPYVITPAPHCDSTAYITPGQYGGCLGARHDPFVLNGDPNAADFTIRDISPWMASPPRGWSGGRACCAKSRGTVPIDTASAREIEIYQAKALSLVTSGEDAEGVRPGSGSRQGPRALRPGTAGASRISSPGAWSRRACPSSRR